MDLDHFDMFSSLELHVKSHIIHSKFCGVSHPKIYIIINISSFLRYWRVLRVSVLRHFNILSRRITNGVLRKLSSWIL